MIDDRLALRLGSYFNPFKQNRYADGSIGRFFKCIDRYAPDVRAGLRDDVWPHFKEMWAQLRKDGRLGDPDAPFTRSFRSFISSGPHRPEDGTIIPEGPSLIEFARVLNRSPTFPPSLLHAEFVKWFRTAYAESDPAVVPFKESLDAWMGRFWLQCPWVELVAVTTICEWERNPDRVEEPTWFNPGILALDFDSMGGEHIEVALPSWSDLAYVEPTTIRSRMVEAFENVVNDAIQRAQNEAEKRGLLTARPGGADHHVEWLVRYQVCGDPYSELEREYKSDRATLVEAIEKLRIYLQLPKRPLSPPGRPKGSKTRNRIHF